MKTVDRIGSSTKALFLPAILGLLLAAATHPGSAAPLPSASVSDWPPEVGIPPGHPILVGTSTALSGPARALGEGMVAGMDAAFDEANSSGGIAGRRISLVALDDGYEPSLAAANMQRLAQDRQVVAALGNVGTPTAVVALPIARESGLPFVAPYTGAHILRLNPPERIVFNFRASYAEETRAMVDALVEVARLKPEQIAVFSQRDAYGDAGSRSALSALRDHGLEDLSLVKQVRYERNTLGVEPALADLLGAPGERPKAVILVGTYAPCARFIRLSRGLGYEPIFLCVSFVGGEALAEELGPYGEGVIVTQVVPHYGSGLPAARAFRNAMARSGAPPSFVAFEGFIAGRLLLEGLRHISDWSVPRTSLIEALEGLGDFDLGIGVQLHLGPDEHQACHTVWPTVIRKGQLEPFDWSQLGNLRTAGPHK